MSVRLAFGVAGVLFLAGGAAAAAEARKAPFVLKSPDGHVTNYDETKVGNHVLPDPLRFDDGEPVKDAETWFSRRRPQILRAYEERIFGRVPPAAPRPRVVTFPDEAVKGRAALRRRFVLRYGEADDSPKVDVVMYVPAGGKRPAPVLLQLVFVQGLAGEAGAAPADAKAARLDGLGPVDDILRRGYAYATFKYTEVQPDHRGTNASGVQALCYAPGQTKPAPEEWGTIAVWAWAASHVVDQLAADPDLDARRVALIGHSRLGKTALWASARDPRFALVFASCSGEMGAALSRRDFGETVDNMARGLGWQFAGNFQQFVGAWNRMPVDAHMLIALSAPRPVFVTGGVEDQWADPKGQFLALVAAGPVYRLLGKQDLGVTTLPPLDEPVISGSLGWLYHRGGHSILPQDWTAFLEFADRHLAER